MGLESATYLDDLNSSNPAAGDNFSQGDDHLRLIKGVMKSTFPGLVGRSWRVQSKSGNYTPVVNDNLTHLLCTAALTLGLTAAATLGNGWMTGVYASGGAVIIDPNSTELVNGASTVTVPKYGSGFLYCDGAAFYFVGTTAGSYTATLTGVSGTVNGTATWTMNGDAVVLCVPNLQGTSTTTAKTITGAPAGLFPAASKNVPILVSDAGGNNGLSYGTLATDGVITVQRASDGTAWTASGTATVNKFQISYTLA